VRSTVGIVLGALGLVCAVIGLLLINGVYFCLPSGGQVGSRPGQILGIVAVILSVISIAVSGLTGSPQ
jgi:hypothetical protein